MTLKDASAYNIQFIGNKPIFIDTLSFEKYIEANPWFAYKQFCQHFLAPLALMAYRSVELLKLHLNYIDGIPIELASSLLPRRSILNSGIASHIILHSKFQKKHSKELSAKTDKAKVSKSSLMAMLQHIEDCIVSLNSKSEKSNWTEYVINNTYSQEAVNIKEQTIIKWLEQSKAKNIYDLGCNTGSYSLLASKYCNHVLSIDSDHNCIEKFYLSTKEKNNILPLVINLSTPSPSSGWANKEHLTINQRGKADVLLALALIHHFRITNNVPFYRIADYLADLGDRLIIEFIPKNDPMVQQMLSSRKDIFSDYKLEEFLNAFEKLFYIDEKKLLENNGRILFLMTKKT